MTHLLLTESMLEHVKADLSNVIYYDPSQDKLVRGYKHHTAGCTEMLSHDDGEQLDWDLDACSGVILYRMNNIEGDE